MLLSTAQGGLDERSAMYGSSLAVPSMLDDAVCKWRSAKSDSLALYQRATQREQEMTTKLGTSLISPKRASKSPHSWLSASRNPDISSMFSVPPPRGRQSDWTQIERASLEQTA